MNRIVKEHYPVEKLPEDLREGLPEGTQVRVTLDLELDWETPVEPRMSLDEIFSAVPESARKSSAQIDREMRRSRDEWGR